MDSFNPNVAFAIPAILMAVAFSAYCLADLAQAKEVRLLDPWAWAVVICISMPLGGFFYLVYGRVR